MATCPTDDAVIALLSPTDAQGVSLRDGTTKLTFRLKWSDASTASSGSGGAPSWPMPQYATATASSLVDVDLAAVLYDEHGTATEIIAHTSPVSSDPAVTVALVTGDQRSGHIGETIVVRLANVSSTIAAVALFVTSPDTKLSIVDVPELKLTISTEEMGQAAPLGTSWGHTVKRSEAPPSESRRRDPVHMRMVASIQRTTGLSAKKKCKSHGAGGTDGEWVLRAHRELLLGLSARDAAAEMAVILGYCTTPAEARVTFPFALFLEKGHTFDLTEGGAALTIGIGWDQGPNPDASSDVDLSCVALDVRETHSIGQLKDMVFWGKLTGLNGAVIHSGDNTDGEGEGLDEFLTVSLAQIPSDVTTLAFIVSSYNRPVLDVTRRILFSVSRNCDEGKLVCMEGIGSEAHAGGSGAPQGGYTSLIPCVLERTEISRGAPATSRGRSNASPNSWRVRVLSIPVAGHSISEEPMRTKVCEAVAAASHHAVVRDGASNAPAQQNAQPPMLNLRRSAALANERSSRLHGSTPQLPVHVRGAEGGGVHVDAEPSKLVVTAVACIIVAITAYFLRRMGL